MITFKELGLTPEIMKSLADLGFKEPTPIQEQSIPFILNSKKDLIASAQTGTGKTAAYSLPILNQLKSTDKDLQAIILCPTRELCLQIFQDIKKFAKYSKKISVTAVYGGERIDIQTKALQKGTNIVVGTPGRVHDLIRRNVLRLHSIKWVVLDEADKMLDMGFKDDLCAILGQTQKSRQTLLFSATMSRNVHYIARQYMREANEIAVGEKNIGADNISHEYYIVNQRDGFEALKRILDFLPGVYGILFCRTKRETQEIADKLKQSKYDTEALHGDISQNMRTKIMDRFKRKQIRLLVATDVAARGIDVSDLSHVINCSLPDQDESYTHRSGRTGRAQKSGVSISIISPREAIRIRQLEYIIGKKFESKKVPNGQEVCKKQMENFIEEIQNTDIKQIGNEKYFSEIADKLKKIKKEDLIKYFVTHKFSDLMESSKNARDLNLGARNFSDRPFNPRRNARPRREMGERKERRDIGETVNFKINFGRKHGFDIKGLFALINSNRNLKGLQLGRINLMSDYSIFAVEKNRADMVMKSLKGTNFRGKRIDIDESNQAAGYPRERRSGAGGGFNRRNGFRRRR